MLMAKVTPSVVEKFPSMGQNGRNRVPIVLPDVKRPEGAIRLVVHDHI